MITPPTPRLQLTATRIAEFFRFGCDRQLHYGLVPSELRADVEIPVPGRDPHARPRVGPRPGSRLLLAEGRRWERRALRRVITRVGPDRALVAGWTADGDPERLPADRVIEALREPGGIDVLVQPELRLHEPERFADRWGFDLDGIELAPAAPDLIRVRRGADGAVRFQIADIKASREARISHFAQIAFYSLLLEEICRVERIEGGDVDTRWGWVWSRGEGVPVRFPLAAYRHHVIRLLREDLPRVARSDTRECAWHLSPRCIGCDLFDNCRDEADRTDDLARVVGITPLAKQTLQSKRVRTVRDLAASFRRDTFEGCHSLESQAAQLQRRAQALAYRKVVDLDRSGTHLMGAREDVRVILSAEGDPVTGLCFALGVAVLEGKGGDPEFAGEVYVARHGSPAAERAMLIDLLGRIGPALDRGQASSVHFFLYDRAELGILRDVLQRHLHSPELRSVLSPLLSILAPGASGHAGSARAAPGTVLADAIAALFALPVPYTHDLMSVSTCLTPTRDAHVYRPPLEYRRPLSSQIAFELIHEAWNERGREAQDTAATHRFDEIRQTALSKLAAIDSVIRAVRERAARGNRLQLRASPLPAAGGDTRIPDPLLETLRIITGMEAAAEAAALRSLHALPSIGRALRFECIRGMHLIERRPDGHLVFEFDPACRDVKFRPGDFNLVLTNDDGRSLLEIDRLPWKRWALMAELVDIDVSADPPRVTLSPASGFAKAVEDGWIDLERQCVLDRAPSDFNTPRIIATLGGLASPDAAFIMKLLSGQTPSDWEAPFALADAVYPELFPRPALNPDQERAWRSALEQPATVIWGPPGTGKTHLLGWILIGVAAAARGVGRPCRVLVTASTHRAIVNVLARVSRQLDDMASPMPLGLVKLRGGGSSADAELADTRVGQLEDEQLDALLQSATESGSPLAVGSTVWSLWKRMKASDPGDSAEGPDTVRAQPWFDVIVIDEASQMKLSEAMVALSALRPGGQVIVCGDDRQLAPVVRGRYEPSDGPGEISGSVFEHFAAHFPRHPLWESRRMNSALVAYPKRLFYPGLYAAHPRRAIRLVPTDPSAALQDRMIREAFLDPGDAVVFCTYSDVRATARNRFEARIVGSIARLMRDGLIDPETGERYGDERFAAEGLAIISPHRAQNSAILAELRGAGFTEDTLPVVDTVERMQGNERDVILVSYSVADREYAEHEAEFLLNPNRFNVSITRARAKLIVLMSEEILRAVPQDVRVMTGSVAVQAYRDHCRDGVRDLELPDEDGTPVPVRCHYRRLASLDTDARLD